MTWFDVLVLTIVAFSGMLGFFRGMVREVLGLAAWIGAAIAAVYFFPDLQGIARKSIANENIADPVAFGLPFLVILIVFSLLARIVGKIVLASVLGGLDRSLGLLYGLARGAALIVVAYIGLGLVQPMDRWPDAVLEARTLPSIYLGARWVAAKLPEGYKPAVLVPPAGRSTDSAALLRATPTGRALSPPPGRP